jgi:putative transposase
VLELLHSDRFVDVAPAEIVATLVDEGTYLCSTRTMYRFLDSVGHLRERRDQLRHPPYRRPELLATEPNQLWSWDITKLLGPAKWTYFYLYVLLDVFSRYVVGWMVERCESATLAARLIDESCRRHGISQGQLTVHSDRGPSMTSRTVAHLLADLGVTRTHSRPHVSNDNPFSEAQFKTLKYRADFPTRFGSIQHARTWCRPFFEWYNHHHRHCGIAYLTPADVHFGRAREILSRRATVLAEAARRHPERFPGRPGSALLKLPEAVWINPPVNRPDAEKGECWDMDRPVISRPGACQRPSPPADPPLSPFPPGSPLSLTHPPEDTAQKAGGVFSEVAH